MPEALYFTEDEAANRLLADDPFALLVGFALDQQVTVQQAFLGPLRLKERLGTLEPRPSRRPTSSRSSARSRRSTASPARWPGGCASWQRPSRRSTAATRPALWTEAADGGDLAAESARCRASAR